MKTPPPKLADSRATDRGPVEVTMASPDMVRASSTTISTASTGVPPRVRARLPDSQATTKATRIRAEESSTHRRSAAIGSREP